METPTSDRIPALEASTINKIYWRFIPLFFICMFFNYLDRANVGFAALRMNKDIGLSPAEFGFGGSVFFFGYMLLGIPSNILLYKTGARTWLALLLIAWGIAATGMAFVNSATTFYATRFLIGIAESGFLPGLAFYMTLWFPKAYRARAIAGYVIAISVASVLGGPVSTFIMSYTDGLNAGGLVLGLHGWQWMFLIEGLPTVLLGAFTYTYLSEAPASAGWLSAEQRAWLTTTLAGEREEAGKAGTSTFIAVVRDPRVWSVAVLFGCALVGIYGMILWLPQIIKSLGTLTDLQVGFLSAVPPLLGVFGTLVVSRSSDRTGDRKFHLAALYALGAVGIFSSAYAGDPVLSYVLLCVAGLGLNSGNSLFWSLASSINSGPAAAVAVATVNTIAQFGGLIGPWVIGLAKEKTGNFSAALVVVAAFLVVSVVIAIFLPVQNARARRSS